MFDQMREAMSSGQMTWMMGGSMLLVGLLLVLAVIALVKYIVFR